MITIGIDQSLTGTGVIVLINGHVYKHTTITTNSSENLIDRVGLIRKRINSIVNQVAKLSADDKQVIVAIEGFSFASRGRSVFDIGYLGWRIKEDLRNMENSKLLKYWLDVPPTVVKKFATGKGNAPKELILQQVYKRWDEEFSDNNQADAFVLAKIAEAYEDKSLILTAFQQEAIESVRKVNHERKH